jgi:peroxiredoxin
MRTTLTALFASLALLCTPLAAQALPELGKPAPAFSFKDINGKPVSSADLKGKTVVLEWTNPTCPFVEKHYGSQSMQKLQAYATGKKKVVWLTINSGAEGKFGTLSPDQARDYIKANNLSSTHYLLDPEGVLGKQYGAKTTPHMFVIDPKGNIAYMGAIDSKPSPDQETLKSATNYVRDAVDAIAAGKPVKMASTQSYGCSVKYN